MQALLQAPMLLKHRTIIRVLYGCGLRCGELRKLKIQDIDFDRNLIHVRNGKGSKDRYVPIGMQLRVYLKQYLTHEKPIQWLFNGKNFNALSLGGIREAIRIAKCRTTIKKRVSPHTFRHTYATHLLEQGLNIVSIKELLGHSHISATMVYLHVVIVNQKAVFSPLDTLYNDENDSATQVEKGRLTNQPIECMQGFNDYLLQRRAAMRLKNLQAGQRQFEFMF